MAANFVVGLYLAKVTSCGFGLTPAKETPFLQVDFSVLALKNPNSGEWELVDPAPRSIKLWMSDAAAPHTIKQLRDWGWQGSDLVDIEKGFLIDTEIEVVFQGLNEAGYEQWDRAMASRVFESDTKVTKLLKAKFAKLLKPDVAAPAAKVSKLPKRGVSASDEVFPQPKLPVEEEDDDPLPF